MTSSKGTLQKLRKRQIVIAGYGTSVLSFCEKFRSDWAEVTVVSEVTDFAPQVVRHGIAAGHLQAEAFSRLLRVRFGKKKNLKFISAKVAAIDTENRCLKLTGGNETIPYDYLLIGDQCTPTKTTSLNTIAESKKVANHLRQQSEKTNLHILGSDSTAIDLAATFSKSHLMQLGSPGIGKVILDCGRGFQFPNREITPKIENQFAQALRWESISLFDEKTVAIGHQTVIELKPFQPNPPAWIPVAEYSNETVTKHIRPDFRLRQEDRIYLLPELVKTRDALGKSIPATDQAWMQQGRYLAKLIAGIIEVKPKYVSDPPGFLLKDSMQFATIRKWKSLGFVGKFRLPAIAAFILDLLVYQRSVFKLAYGNLGGFSKLFLWLQLCK